MERNQLEWVCRNLGHTGNVHKQHYQITSSHIEHMKISDFNLSGKFQGQDLNKIDIKGNFTICFQHYGNVVGQACHSKFSTIMSPSRQRGDILLLVLVTLCAIPCERDNFRIILNFTLNLKHVLIT